MIDIHCHLLPGLDDGADTLETAFDMAEMAIAQGITHVIGTPHASPEYQFIPELVKQRRDELQEQFEGRLVIASGCDFHLSFENLREIRSAPERFTVNQKNYLLVEFAEFSIPPSLDQALHELQLAGLRPIITHPERHPQLRRINDEFKEWVRMGCLVQVTAQSLLGRFGRKSEESGWDMIRSGVAHFVASDAHDTTDRPPRLDLAFQAVSGRLGEPCAKRLFVENPTAVIVGGRVLTEPPKKRSWYAWWK